MDNICCDGKFLNKKDFSPSINNRAFKYGDSFFETIKCYLGLPIFWEEHYFRIAASLCIMKMNPPSSFNMESFSSLIQNLLNKNNLQNCASRVRISFFRHEGGYYYPLNNNTSYLIESEEIEDKVYQLNSTGLNIGLYRENILPKNILSNIKSNNRLINILASIYAKNHDYDDCFLFNNEKNIVESTSGNIFIVLNNVIITPRLEDGCVDGIIRKILLKEKKILIQEKSISLLDLFNADEVFVSNVICGVKWVKSIGDHKYNNTVSVKIIELLNNKYLI